MKTIAVVGLDLAKSVFQIHAIDADGKVAVRRLLRRGEVLKFFGVLSPCRHRGRTAGRSTPQIGTLFCQSLTSLPCPASLAGLFYQARPWTT
jgi:hypothetical protein